MTITEKPENRDLKLKRLQAAIKDVDAQIKELKTRRTNGVDQAIAGLQEHRRRFYAELNARRVSLAASNEVARKSLAKARGLVIDKKQVKALKAVLEHMHVSESQSFQEGYGDGHIYHSVAVLMPLVGLKPVPITKPKKRKKR